ncbi:hypothetical protein ABPG74_019879 [Tetrahymena malaccensis]
MSKAIDKPETQQLKSTQSLDGNTKFMSPEVFKGEKPYSIKADIFSIGQLLVEVFLQRPLTPTEWLNLKTKSLFECIPELSIHDNTNNSKFVYEILANMVNPDKTQRLEPVTLLQKLNEIQKYNINEDSLKSLKLKQKLKQELKRIFFNSKNNITNQVDLSSYQEVELDYYECFKKILFYQVFGISDVVKAINIISQQDQIISLILHLGSNKIGSEGTKGIGVGLEILQNLTYLSHDISNQCKEVYLKKLNTQIVVHLNLLTNM